MTRLLSFAIPTWNRARYLEQLLEALATQIAALQYDIEVLISDNASTDSTPEVVRRYQQRFDFIRYHRNPENLGAVKNVTLAVQRADAEYVWLFCDDDLPAPGAVQQVYGKLTEYNGRIALMFVNRSIHDAEFTKTILDRVHAQATDIFYPDGRDLFDEFNDDLLTGSCLVFRKRACFGPFSDRSISQFYSTTLVLSIQALARGGGYFVADPLVKYREGDKSSWVHLWPVFFAIDIPHLVQQSLSLGFPRTAFRRVTAKRDTFLPKAIIFWKTHSNLLREEKARWRDVILLYYRYPWFWLVSFWLILIPAPFMQFGVFSYKRMRSLVRKSGGSLRQSVQ
jgi:glycosyltransferase involved in cell wall biosynthesis